MNLRNLIALVVLTVPALAQQNPGKGIGPAAGQTRIFQQAVLEAADGATLYADQYAPPVKEGIVIPAGKSLTIVGGTFRATPEAAGIAGADWAERLDFEASIFLGREDGYRAAALTSNAQRTTLHGCIANGGSLLFSQQAMIVDSYLDAGNHHAPADQCAARDGWPAVSGWQVAVVGGVISGGDAAPRPDVCACDGTLARGGPALASTWTFLSLRKPPVLVGGWGESGPCGEGARGAQIDSLYVVWSDK